MKDPITNLDELKKAEKALIKLDPVLGKLIKLQGPVIMETRGGYFISLCRSIIGQQVSVASANAIFSRLESTTNLLPERILALSPEEVKTIGLSRQKLSYLQDLAGHFVSDPNVYEHLGKLSDDEVIEDLTKVKGIGVWTAQMFLMFTLQRLDVFAPDDIGLQRGMKLLYGWEEVPPKPEIIEIAEKWSPYRTVASMHLWKSLRNTPITK
jgi:DNA-3-methyladenine glycosylase II